MALPTNWTVGLLLSTLFALLAWTQPLAAQTPWEQNDQIQISMYLPSVPLLLTVNCTREQQRCVETRAFLTIPDHAATETTHIELPATMIATSSATSAVVQFDDGGTITFEAIPGQHDRIVEVVNTPRIIYQSTQNNAYASGTLLGQAVDTREDASACVSCIQIISIFLRWQP